jgi:hypothetical protein
VIELKIVLASLLLLMLLLLSMLLLLLLQHLHLHGRQHFRRPPEPCSDHEVCLCVASVPSAPVQTPL